MNCQYNKVSVSGLSFLVSTPSLTLLCANQLPLDVSGSKYSKVSCAIIEAISQYSGFMDIVSAALFSKD